MQESEDFLHWPFCRCLGMRTDPEKWNQERSRTDAPRVWLLSSYPLCAPLTFPRRFMNKPNNLLFTITFAFLRWTDFRFRIYCPAIQWAFHICEASLTKTNVSTPILPSFVFRLSKQGSFSATALNVPILYIACSSYEATSFAGCPINCVNSVLLTKGIRTVVRDPFEGDQPSTERCRGTGRAFLGSFFGLGSKRSCPTTCGRAVEAFRGSGTGYPERMHSGKSQRSVSRPFQQRQLPSNS